MSKEYLEQIIDEIFEIVTHGTDWPRNFNNEQRIHILKSIVAYYQSLDTHEGYIKCAKLQNIIEHISQADNYRMDLGDTTKSGSVDLFKN